MITTDHIKYNIPNCISGNTNSVQVVIRRVVNNEASMKGIHVKNKTFIMLKKYVYKHSLIIVY